MPQTPMLSCPLKQTSEVDWIQPLKLYIRDTYQDDPERYSEECATLNRLRQDMRGAGKDSAAGRDLLYRYYGQLELLDLRFPVDENHIKISFTWFDAFTHKPISQYSLAYEKASIIFNISAVLSCHAANQNRADDTGLKTAYHSFQASAGMFNYINENFLHAPSTDLSRETVKTLIAVTLAQGQEVFLEKQIADGKKVGLLAKLASQAATLYVQAVEGVADNVARSIFEKVWLSVVQLKASYMSSLAQYYQALADEDANSHGVAIARLTIAEREAKDAARVAGSIPSTPPPGANLAPDTGSILADMVKRHLVIVQEKLAAVSKDNDYIYHLPVPAEASLSVVPKLPAAKAIPVSELYQGQDIQRIIGPDIFQRIVPMAVTESASLYDEEKAKLVRAEVEKVERANDEMAASLDYLKLPGSLDVLKGGMDQEVTVDDEFRRWCEELAGHEPFGGAFDQLHAEKQATISMLNACSKQLDLEENVCEKMRVKYNSDWTQQPSSRLNATLRSDIRSYRDALDQAGGSDAQLLATSRQYESDFEEMRSAGETDEADVLYQRAMIKAGGSRGKGRNPQSPSAEGNLLDEDYGEGGMTVMEQIRRIEDMLKKLNLIKKDRGQVLKDLKEKVHNDDISNVLILNKKSIANHETKLFEAELEKFRPHQNRLLQANHKQASLMKDLTRAYSELLQDKRVRSEQAKYDTFTRQRNTILSRYRKVFGAFNDLVKGLERARAFYAEMKDTVENLNQNVDAFVDNRREEGAQLLAQIERKKHSSTSAASGSSSAGAQSGADADRERERLRELMERMQISPNSSAPSPPKRSASSASRPQAGGSAQPAGFGYPAASQSPSYNASKPTSSANAHASYPSSRSPAPPQPQQQHPSYAGYNQPPAAYPADPYRQAHPAFDPALHPQYAYAQQPHPAQQYTPQHPTQQQQPPSSSQQPPKSPPAWGYPPYATGQPQLPQGYVPPPPPPGPPPPGSGYPPQNAHSPPQPMQFQYPGQQAAGGGPPPRQGSSGPQGDPWAGLGAWR